MRTQLIAGNWKMNTTLQEADTLIGAIRRALPELPAGVSVVVCPPHVALARASEQLAGTRIAVGAQDMSEHDDGAHTGEVSWRMLRSAGCSYVILGHSERRQYAGETDGLINRKARKALAGGLTPIICVGETLEQREQGVTADVVTGQVRGVLDGFTEEHLAGSVIAYEPVWAIGTGRNATPEQAQEVHLMIRSIVRESHGERVAGRLLLLYGGSVKPDNASDLLRQSDIDGALVGGASLKADSFAAIVRSAPAGS